MEPGRCARGHRQAVSRPDAAGHADGVGVPARVARRDRAAVSDLAGLSLTEAARRLRNREATAVELVDACLARVEQWEPHVHALVTVLGEQAISWAEQADRELAGRRPRGPLHGVPVVVKDLIDVSGVPTEAGSQILAGSIAATDAAVIVRLKDAGAIILAKANTHEFAYGALTPPTRNPWDLDRMPGGSSGGSAAAVAAGEAFGALGTDTAGSVREPAALCGTVGLKPTYGRINCQGVVPLAWSLDTVGPMTRIVEDCALLFGVLAPTGARRAGPPAAISCDPGSSGSGLASLRVAVASELMQPLEPAVADTLDDLLEALSAAGAVVEPVSIGDPDELTATLFVILLAESASYHRPWLESCPERYGADVLAYLEMAADLTAVDYVDAQRLRVVQRSRIDAVLARADVLLAPSQQVVAPRVDTDTVVFPTGETAPRDLTLIRPLAPFSLTGHPALTVPLRLGDQGLPIGVQLVGAPFGDERLLEYGSAMQQILGWDTAAPPSPALPQRGL
ncbi:MAG: amidase [Acidimicrobiaceae bacterium]|nr:amidase [Acidimicrobiaceae bacterium]